MALESRFIDLERNAGEQGLMTFTALRQVRRPVHGKAVYLTTMAADNVAAAVHRIPNLPALSIHRAIVTVQCARRATSAATDPITSRDMLPLSPVPTTM